MEDSELLNKLNTTRKALAYITESIYQYLGNVITKDQLKANVDSILSESRAELLKHKYLNKDYIETIDDLLKDEVEGE